LGLTEGLKKYDCHMVVPKIFFFDEPNKIWCAGGYFDWLRGTAAHFGFGQEDKGKFDHPRKVGYSPTCCMLINSEVFEDVGLMDSNYFVYFDDTDFCLRAHRAGKRLVYLAGSRLLHKVSSMVGHRSNFALRYLVRNHAYYVLKNFGRWMAWYYLPICQAHVLARCLLASEKARAFSIAEKAFLEGILLFHSGPSSAELAPSSTTERLPQNTCGAQGLPKEANMSGEI